MDAGRYHSNEYNDEVIQGQCIVLINTDITEKQFGLGVLNQGTFGKQIRETFWVRYSLHTSQVAQQAGAYPSFLSMN